MEKIKGYFSASLKLALALLVLFAILDLITYFTGFSLQSYIFHPLASFLPAKNQNN